MKKGKTQITSIRNQRGLPAELRESGKNNKKPGNTWDGHSETTMEKIKFPAHPERGGSVAIYVGRRGFCSLVLCFKYVYAIYVCAGSAHECRLPTEAGGVGSSWSWSYRWLSPDVGAGNQTQDLWKGVLTLSRLSSLARVVL